MARVMLFVFMGCLAAQVAAADGADEIVVRDAWVRDVPPVASATAAYMVIENKAQTVRTLVGAASPYFEEVQMHRTVEEGGLARMVRQESIKVEPGSKLTMKPGDYHLMLIGFKQRVKAGEAVPIRLLFEGGVEMQLSATVKQSGGGESLHHEHHHH